MKNKKEVSLKEKGVNKKISLPFKLVVLLFILFSVFLLVTSIPSVQAGSKDYSMNINWYAVGIKGGTDERYFNFTPEQCPGSQGGCFISNITIQRTIFGNGASGSTEGQAYLRIANTAGSDCENHPSPPTDVAYTTYSVWSPLVGTGGADVALDCGSTSGSTATCNDSTMNVAEGYDNSSANPCFSVATHAESSGGGGEFPTLSASIVYYTWNFTGPNVLDTPSPTGPVDGSAQVASPVVLSWSSVTGASSYDVYVDQTDGSTFRANTDAVTYQESQINEGTVYWKVKAIGDDIEYSNSSFTSVQSYTIDLCGPDPAYDSTNYKMDYDNETDTIIVMGNETYGNSSNPITFEDIFGFARAVRGVCAMTNPATGTYAILTHLVIGNASSPGNYTYVKTSGESIDFAKQVNLTANATLIVGETSDEANPYKGTTLSFSGTTAAVDPGQGLLFMENDSNLEMYDSFLIHKETANDSNQWKLYWWGDITAKRSSLESWWTIRFLGDYNNLEDIVITNVGEGFYPATTQTGSIDTVKSRKTTQDGVYFVNNTNVTIDSLTIAETNWSDIRVENYTGVANLLNPDLNFSSINWSTGTYTGQILQKYTYDLTVTDSAG
ncbi:hypothetical protein GOV03_02755, partial [Candidatus Woesearchaeota archaeon]|nr:hypothetical protein [Candidatus Woesearchaeota archaeon]